MVVVICVVSVLILFGVLYYLFPFIQVTGDSMSPTYHDGEIIIGTRLYKKDNLEVGDVVLYKSPTEKGRIVIKRIDHFMNEHGNLYLYFLGDNADCSYDSRYYGFVSSKNLVCKVINQRRKVNYDSCN